MRKRTRSREFALQVLYEIDVAGPSCREALQDFWLDRSDLALSNSEKEAVEKDKQEPEIRQYTEQLVEGTLDKLTTIDPTIERYAENWEMDRMALVDRNILRLAAYEMLFVDDIPLKVAINEAVEMAKRYGEADSSKFVNGILDRIAKTECKTKT